MTKSNTISKGNIIGYLDHMVKKVQKERPTSRQEFLCWQRRVKLMKEIRHWIVEEFKDEHKS